VTFLPQAPTNWSGRLRSFLASARVATGALTIAAATLAGSPAAAQDMKLDVTLEGDLLSVRARNAPLSTVLEAIATATHRSVRVQGAGDPPVTVTLSTVSVEDAIRRIVHHDYVLTSDRLTVFLTPAERRITSIGAGTATATVARESARQPMAGVRSPRSRPSVVPAREAALLDAEVQSRLSEPSALDSLSAEIREAERVVQSGLR
jgi:hypothetical protein